MRTSRSRTRGDRGASAVELALVTPFLTALLVGAIEIGLIYGRSQELEGVARDAARHGAADANSTQTEIISRVTNALDTSDGVSVSVDPDVDEPCSGRPGDPLTVTLQTSEALDLLFAATVSINLTGEAQFLCTTDQ